MRCTPNTSWSPAATRKRTEAWNTPPIRTSKKEVNGSVARSQLDVRGFDPLPEVDAGRLLQLIRIHLRHVGDGGEVVPVLVRREALVEGLLRDVVLAHLGRVAERFHLQ